MGLQRYAIVETISTSWVLKFPWVSISQTEEKTGKDRIKVFVYKTNIHNINKIFLRKEWYKENNEILNSGEVLSPVYYVLVLCSLSGFPRVS